MIPQRNATQRNATQRNATQRNATQRNATQRNATQRNALLKKRIPVSPKSSFSAGKFQIFSIILGTFKEMGHGRNV